MRKNWKRVVALLLVCASLSFNISCSTCRPLPLHSVAEMGDVSFAPEKQYEVLFATGPTYRLNGSAFHQNGNLIGIDFGDKSEIHYYRPEQFQKICVREPARGKTIAFAVGGGVAGVALIAGIVGLVLFGRAQH